MKVLWITNIVFPEAERLMTGAGELKCSGGWMLGAANALVDRDDVILYVAAVSPEVTCLTKLVGEKITYYIIPAGKGNTDYNLDYCPYWKRIKDEINPDVVHIHGTEYSHGYAYM